MKATDPTHHINEAHGTSYRLRSRFGAGEQGAYALETPDGSTAVLKLQPGPAVVKRYAQLQATTDLLRTKGYPTPRYLHIGTDGETSYAVQSALPGKSVEALSPAHVARLIEINQIQRGLAPEENPDWQRNLVHSVLYGWEEYCVIQSLRDYSTESATLLGDLQSIVSRWDGTPVRMDDIVHFDFHHLNMLMDGDIVTGVVDWDGLTYGDCTFDLVTLLFYNYDNQHARDTLRAEIMGRVSLDTALSYIAHMIVRQVDWTIRFYEPAFVDRFLVRGRQMLEEMASPLDALADHAVGDYHTGRTRSLRDVADEDGTE